eukprot:gene9404-9568_t
MRRYHIQDRDDYMKYNKMVGLITKLTNMLKQLDPQDKTRIELTDQLLAKLYDMGVLPTKKSLVQTEQLATASFCRRRLAVVMVRLKMAETVREAATFVEQHVQLRQRSQPPMLTSRIQLEPQPIARPSVNNLSPSADRLSSEALVLHLIDIADGGSRGGRSRTDEMMDEEGISVSENVKVVKSFDQMGMRDDLLRGIFAYGFEKPSAIQQRALLPIVQGRDVIAQAQSGTGKSSLIAMSICQMVDTKNRE